MFDQVYINEPQEVTVRINVYLPRDWGRDNESTAVVGIVRAGRVAIESEYIVLPAA